MVLAIKSFLSHISSSSPSTLRRSHGSTRMPSSTISTHDGSHGSSHESSSQDDSNHTPSAMATRIMTLEDLSILKLLGKGASGSVYLTRDTVTGKHFALKVIKKEGRSATAIYAIVHEQRIQSMLSGSACFVSLEASWHDENNFYLVMPYYAGGDLSFELMRCRTFESERARFYAAELVIALERLHNMNIMHRDIKPGNIVFDDNGHIALADFGLAKIFEPNTKSDHGDVSLTVDEKINSTSSFKQHKCIANDVCGTPFYMSPEMHFGEDYSFDVDYWALGIVLYRMLTGRMALGADAEDRNEMAEMIAEDDLRFLDGDNVDTVTRDLLRKLLAKNPQDRLTVEEIKAHPYFKGIDWRKVAARKLDTPWKPYLHPIPKNPRADPGFTKGRAYDAASDPYPTYHSFHAEFFANTQNIERNSTASRSGTNSRSARGFFGISNAPRRLESSHRSGLRNIVFSHKTISHHQTDIPQSRTPGSSLGIRSVFGPRQTRPANSRVRVPVKSESGRFKDVKRWMKRMWIPKVKPLVGARVDLLA